MGKTVACLLLILGSLLVDSMLASNGSQATARQPRHCCYSCLMFILRDGRIFLVYLIMNNLLKIFLLFLYFLHSPCYNAYMFSYFIESVSIATSSIVLLNIRETRYTVKFPYLDDLWYFSVK